MNLHLAQVARVCPCWEDLWLHLNTQNKKECIRNPWHEDVCLDYTFVLKMFILSQLWLILIISLYCGKQLFLYQDSAFN